MGGVDSFDQRIAAYRVVRRTNKYWKRIFFDLLEVATVNSYILFNLWQERHLGQINRPRMFSHEDYRANLIGQLADFPADAPVPLYKSGPQQERAHPPAHLPQWREERRNCQRCYVQDRQERKRWTTCSTCHVFLHVNHRDCFQQYHIA